MGQYGPHEHFSVACIGITMAWDCCNLGQFFCFDGRSGSRYWGRGNWPVSNRFSEADPALGQGVPRALGMSSSGGGFDSWFGGLVVGHGTSENCPVANLYSVTCIDVAVNLVTGVWGEVVATAGGVQQNLLEWLWW